MCSKACLICKLSLGGLQSEPGLPTPTQLGGMKPSCCTVPAVMKPAWAIRSDQMFQLKADFLQQARTRRRGCRRRCRRWLQLQSGPQRPVLLRADTMPDSSTCSWSCSHQLVCLPAQIADANGNTVARSAPEAQGVQAALQRAAVAAKQPPEACAAAPVRVALPGVVGVPAHTAAVRQPVTSLPTPAQRCSRSWCVQPCCSQPVQTSLRLACRPCQAALNGCVTPLSP